VAGERSSDLPWDDDDEQADFDDESALDAFDIYVPAEEPDDVDGPWEHSEPPRDGGDQLVTVLFTATNPAATVSVTALMDGRVVKVDLSPQITTMTEAQLAEEITVIAAMARRQAQAGQHAVAAELMHQLGHDHASTRGFLERELGLPSPQTVIREKADVFATRYADDHE
jgi:hypothetical protein